ncbi:hypothetical protein J6590_026375 [Homalodisca vitripennis]|nr:hypothetical protein J6590_026375 [Homalodisca vitripennis]
MSLYDVLCATASLFRDFAFYTEAESIQSNLDNPTFASPTRSNKLSEVGAGRSGHCSTVQLYRIFRGVGRGGTCQTVQDQVSQRPPADCINYYPIICETVAVISTCKLLSTHDTPPHPPHPSLYYSSPTTRAVFTLHYTSPLRGR